MMYAYEQLDSLVYRDLKPELLLSTQLTKERVREIIKNIDDEIQTVINQIKQNVYHAADVKEAVQKAHDTLVLLINKAYDHVTHPDSTSEPISEVHQYLLKRLGSVLTFLESHYPRALDQDERMPVTRLVILREKIALNMAEIKIKLVKGKNSPKLQNVILELLNDFIEKIDRGEMVTMKEADYHLHVVQDILNDNGRKTSISDCPSLHELLIHWNVNSRKCIQYFTQGTDEMVKNIETIEDKLEFFQLQYVNLHKIPDIPDFIYNPRLPSVKAHLTEYVTNEIEYLEKKIAGFFPMKEVVPPLKEKRGHRTFLKASVDQIGLFVRALDDINVIEAKSRSALFRAVASLVSTPGATEPSWDNMRSKSYVAEESDKEVVLEILDSLANKIKSY